MFRTLPKGQDPGIRRLRNLADAESMGVYTAAALPSGLSAPVAHIISTALRTRYGLNCRGQRRGCMGQLTLCVARRQAEIRRHNMRRDEAGHCDALFNK